ncbi:hypothetical protein BO94DRAFT_561011 [Aspergillus sclerotioniger CBS 115572]|uniref:Uncharacterized protein n=1 Tax=Aspergillus sclerotioniger CBS 115572 TaxID=1450535 RepID=A0A317V444_9EURO|nr:hypothetical protein BO94DRAFT_561011 [Aspergillus sclerotioniger CBS 115572]PWY68111.1 hypothetical protein BO94DRAFT_561011 [Aspergillus sclerotioniger CBS 115572]
MRDADFIICCAQATRRWSADPVRPGGGMHGVLTVMGRTEELLGMHYENYQRGRGEEKTEGGRGERDQKWKSSSVREQRVCDAHPVTRWFERKQVKCKRELPLDRFQSQLEIRTADWKAVKPQRRLQFCTDPAWRADNWHGGLCLAAVITTSELVFHTGTKRGLLFNGTHGPPPQSPGTGCLTCNGLPVRWRADASCPAYKALYLSSPRLLAKTP